MDTSLEPPIKVQLVSFNGQLKAPSCTDPKENFWLLIGRTGTVINKTTNEDSSKKRHLVVFDESVSELGLPCHNEIQNSLWILESDLHII